MSLVLYDLCGRDREVRFSPYCWRAKLALAIKGLTYRTVATGFTEIAAVAGGVSKTVPILDDNGTVVQDSFAIALHLDTGYPDRPFLFTDEASVAAARFVESWAFSCLHPIIMRMIVLSIHAALSDADQAYFRPNREARLGRSLEEHQTGVEANADAFRAALAPVRHTLARHEWLGGSHPGFPDCIPFGTLMWLETIAGSLPLAVDDAVRIWFGRCRDLHERTGGLAAE